MRRLLLFYNLVSVPLQKGFLFFGFTIIKVVCIVLTSVRYFIDVLICIFNHE